MTQDAPAPGWLDAYAAASRRTASARRSGRTSAAGHLRDDRARADRVLRRLRPGPLGPGDPLFLSNVNACYRRSCWEQVRFRDVRYAEDQAFARDCTSTAGRGLRAGRGGLACSRLRRSASCAATSTSTAGCTRRAGTWNGSAVRSLARHRRAGVRRSRLDARSGLGPSARRAGPAARPPTTPGGGSHRRWARGRTGCPSEFSPRSRSSAGPAGRGRESRPRVGHLWRGRRGRACGHGRCWTRCRAGRRRAAAHRGRDPGVPARQRRAHDDLQPALAPRSAGTPARPGCSTRSAAPDEWPAVIRAEWSSSSRRSPRRSSRASTSGTAPMSRGDRLGDRVPRAPAARLPRAGLPRPGSRVGVLRQLGGIALRRATYGVGLYWIAAAPGCEICSSSRYGRHSTYFSFGVDHGVYHPRPGAAAAGHGDLLLPRRDAAAGRPARAARVAGTAPPPPRRALRALRRPDPCLDHLPLRAPRRRQPGDAGAPLRRGNCRRLAVAHQLLADPAGDVGLRAALRRLRRPRDREACTALDGPIELAAADVNAVADALERLLADDALRERRAREGLAVAAGHSWDRAADEVERGLRAALRERLATR